MSRKLRSSGVSYHNQSVVFAALADETRLAIVSKLSNGQAQSIASLTTDTHLTRQAVTKHLQVLQNVGIVRSTRTGRENLFQFVPKPINDVKKYLDFVSTQWDETLLRLKAFVED